jgi:GAF domain-containing protein
VPASSDYAQSIAEAARTLYKARSLDETLQTIVEVACNSVPGFDHVGIATAEKNGDIVTRAVIGDLVVPLDKLQYGLREGPCSSVLQGTEIVSVSSLERETRWPSYVSEARESGVRSQLAVRLYVNDGAVGGINFYSTIADEVSHDSQMFARLFATHAAIALGHAQERASLTEGLRSRKTIGQAIGILMQRHQITEDPAFAFLVRASSHRNIKLRAVAHELVAEVTDTAVRPDGQQPGSKPTPIPPAGTP